MNLPRRVLLGMLVVLGLPALAHAQLLPRLPIRRQRPDCSQENPQYRMIRQEYWGYYPTCWRKFPPGWGCPSPEAPDWAAAKVQRPLDPPRLPGEEGDDLGPDEGGMEPEQPGDRPRVNPPDDGLGPDLPPEPRDTGSPFNVTPKPADRPIDSPPPADDAPAAGAAAPPPLGGLPRAEAKAPARRRTIVAGLLGGRRR